MLLDAALGVVVSVGAEHETVLGAARHGLGIYIVAGRTVTHQPAALAPQAEVFYGLVVDAGVVVFQDGVEVYLRLGDVQQGLFSCHFLCLNRVENVIRGCGHLGDNGPGGPKGCKRLYSYHGYQKNIFFEDKHFFPFLQEKKPAKKSPAPIIRKERLTRCARVPPRDGTWRLLP